MTRSRHSAVHCSLLISHLSLLIKRGALFPNLMRQTAAFPSRPPRSIVLTSLRFVPVYFATPNSGPVRLLDSLRDLPFWVKQVVKRQAKQCTALFRPPNGCITACSPSVMARGLTQRLPRHWIASPGGGFGFHVNLSFHAEGCTFGATLQGLAMTASHGSIASPICRSLTGSGRS
jgi:hypothetical protein